MLGTLDFMSPEQRSDASRADAGSDQWSLAATFYQLVTGEVPRVIDGAVLPESVREVVLRALRTRPEDRFESIACFGQALQEAVAAPAVHDTGLSAAEEGQCLDCGTINDPRQEILQRLWKFAADGLPRLSRADAPRHDRTRGRKRHRRIVAGVAAVLLLVIVAVCPSSFGVFRPGSRSSALEEESTGLLPDAIPEHQAAGETPRRRSGTASQGARIPQSSQAVSVMEPPQEVEIGLRTPADWKDWRCHLDGRILPGDAGGWRMDASGVVSSTDDLNHGFLSTERPLADFELNLEYRLSAVANSGILFRGSKLSGTVGTGFLEIQLIDEDGWRAQRPGQALRPEQRNGALYGIEPARRQAGRPAGQWNMLQFRSVSSRITVTLNGQEVLQVDLADSAAAQKAVSDRAILNRAAGLVGLRKHVGQVAFRKLVIREITAPDQQTLSPGDAGGGQGTPLMSDPTAAGFGEWQSLLNGVDLSGWTVELPAESGAVPSDDWAVQDGILCGSGTGQSWLSTDREFGSFTFRCEYRFPSGFDHGPRGSGVVVAFTTGSPPRTPWELKSTCCRIDRHIRPVRSSATGRV